MSNVSERLAVLRRAGPKDAARLVFRKAVYRKVEMIRYEVAAGRAVAPPPPLELDIEFLGPSQFGDLVGLNPYLSPDDVQQFQAYPSLCIVARDGDRVAASSWMSRGTVRVNDLQRTIDLAADEHFSSKSYVDPAYRGRSLSSHLVHAYARAQRPTDRIWGLIFDWNVASIRSAERIGRRATGRYWTRHVLGRQFSGEEHFAPLPPSSSRSSP